MNFGADGLIAQSDGDQGDTCQREGMYWFLYWFNFVHMSKYHLAFQLPRREYPEFLIDKLEIAPGIYVRDPDMSKWYSSIKTTSRDQLIPIIWYCGAFNDYRRLGRLFWSCGKRGFFAQNTVESRTGQTKLPDTMLPALGAFIRAGGWYTAIFYPLLLLLDVFDLIGVIVWLLTPRALDDVDDNNAVIGHLGAVVFKPTPISWFSRQLYARFRPKSSGLDTNRVMAALKWYHRPGAGGNKEFVTLFSNPVDKYFKGAFR